MKFPFPNIVETHVSLNNIVNDEEIIKAKTSRKTYLLNNEAPFTEIKSTRNKKLEASEESLEPNIRENISSNVSANYEDNISPFKKTLLADIQKQI